MKQKKIALRENDCRPIAIFYIRNYDTTSCDIKKELISLRRSESLYSYFKNSLKSTRICAVALIFFRRQEIYTFHQNLRVVYFCQQIAFYYEMCSFLRVPQLYFIPQKEKYFISYFIFLFREMRN